MNTLAFAFQELALTRDDGTDEHRIRVTPPVRTEVLRIAAANSGTLGPADIRKMQSLIARHEGNVELVLLARAIAARGMVFVRLL